MNDLWQRFMDMMKVTEMPRQLLERDIAGLTHNLWFMLPFCLLIAWLIYRKSWQNIAIIAVITGLWWFSGSSYMDGTVVDGKPILAKLIPVAGVFLVAVVIIAYLLFL